jgi:hypothetical protein
MDKLRFDEAMCTAKGYLFKYYNSSSERVGSYVFHFSGQGRREHSYRGVIFDVTPA